MSRYWRLSSLARLLGRRGQHPLSLEEICDALECSHSTADRCIRDLRDGHGYPIEYDAFERGYVLRTDGRSDGEPVLELPGLFFSEAELCALLTFRQLLKGVSPSLFEKDLVPLGNRVEKLLAGTGVDPSEVARRIRILAIGSREADDDVFRAVADAAITRRRLYLEYRPRGREEEWKPREVSPQRLVRYRDNWYLDGWCHLREGLRVFALDRMRAVRVTGRPAREVDDDVLDRELGTSYGIFTGQPTERARLRFSARRAQWVSRESWHPDQVSRQNGDGTFELEIPYDRPEELLMDILRHGPEVEVLGPPSLRRQVKELTNGVMAIYAGDE